MTFKLLRRLIGLSAIYPLSSYLTPISLSTRANFPLDTTPIYNGQLPDYYHISTHTIFTFSYLYKEYRFRFLLSLFLVDFYLQPELNKIEIKLIFLTTFSPDTVIIAVLNFYN